MRYTQLLTVIAFVFLLGACDSGDDPVDPPSSQIVIRNASNGSTISTSQNKGAITLDVGDQRTLDVIRIVDDEVGAPEEIEVTADADFNFSDDDIAAVNVNGQLTALAAGFATVIVKYREDDNDPLTEDTVEFDLTVRP
jgi:hypothetical protein